MSRHLFPAMLLAASSLGTHAAPVQIVQPFINFENRAENSLGFTTGAYLRIGANSVTPNGAAGTTGTATRLDPVTLQPVGSPSTVFFNSSPVSPNFFSRVIPLASTNYDPYLLKFQNPSNESAQTTLQLKPDAKVIDFVQSITLSGSGAQPTFGWAPPPGTHVDGYRVNVYDKSIMNNDPTKGPLSDGNVISTNFGPQVTSFSVTSDKFTVPGYTNFKFDTKYSIEISIIQTRDGSTTNLNNANLQSISRVYADFTRKADGGPVVNLPVVRVDGSYKFNMAIEAGKTYYIDPDVAVGYDYAIGAGDPNFQSVLLPSNIGDGLFDIYGFDNFGQLLLLADNWAGGAVFDFGQGGVSRFRVTGIEVGAGLDPADTTAFVTGLTFTGTGSFTGTQTPIVQSVAAVPEPDGLALFGLAMAGLLWTRCRKTALKMPRQAARHQGL